MCETWKWDRLNLTFEVTANVEEFNAMTESLFIRYTDGREVPYRDVVKGFALLNQNDRIEKAILRAAVEATGDENIMVVTQTRRTEMDLTKIDKPFGQLDIETKLALHRAFYEGKEIVWLNQRADDWTFAPEPRWMDHLIYRVKPEQMRDIGLPWHVISSDFKWATRDEDGIVYIWTTKPNIHDAYWSSDISVGCYDLFCASFLIHDPGNKPWNESLIQRPEGM